MFLVDIFFSRLNKKVSLKIFLFSDFLYTSFNYSKLCNRSKRLAKSASFDMLLGAI